MNEFIELAKVLDDAGYEIVAFSNEYYDKEHKPGLPLGITLKIMRVKYPKENPSPAENI